MLARKLAVARLVHSNSAHSTHIMKRDIYYSNPNLFPNQATTDRLLHQLGSSISATLPELSVLPASRGLVYGPIHWLDDGTEVSASVIPRGIPLGAFECEDVSAVLVVEKESIFGELVSNGISDVLRCLIVTAKGYPNLQTLNFLRRLASSQRASAYVLYALFVSTILFQAFKAITDLTFHPSIERTPILSGLTSSFTTVMAPR